MLGFFRTYQRVFYIMITIVVVISFSFFGTYGTMTQQGDHDQPVFTTVTGQAVSRAELERMVLFLGTDALDKQTFGGAWGPNFLNDGVIRRDFLETGLGEVLLNQYLPLFQEDFRARLQKEKKWTAYKHPQANFMTAEMAWSYFAPNLKESLDGFRNLEDGGSEEAVASRIELYLQQQQFPASALRQILMYQERQYDWVSPDARLPQQDLALFQYHTVDDWFGPRFTHLVSQFIFNAAAIAEKQGYRVSKEEAMVDLLRQNDRSFQQNSRSPQLGVANSDEYLKEQLRRMGLGEAQAVKLWQRVLLFRRMFEDVGHAALVDPLMFEKFSEYAGEGVEVETYHLPQELRFSNFRSVQKFEVYLDAVAKPEKGSLLLPKTFHAGEQVATKYPSLVQKRYLIDLQEVDKGALEAQVGIKEAWDWQLGDHGWALLSARYPDLAAKKATTEDARLAALENLDPRTRGQLDRFTREQIVSAHPEWKEAALEASKKQRIELALRLSGGKSPLEGIQDTQDLIERLDKAVAGSLSEIVFSPDEIHHYRLSILDGPTSMEVLTFAEANREGILDEMLDARLEEHYLKVREARKAEFEEAPGQWKALADVRHTLAKDLFGGLLEEVRKQHPGELAVEALNDVASKRLYAFVAQQREANASQESAAEESSQEGLLSSRPPLAKQWKLSQDRQTVLRSSDVEFEVEQAFALSENSLSAISSPDSGDISFFKVLRFLEVPVQGGMGFLMDEGKEVLGREAKLHLLLDLVDQIARTDAMSFDYLQRSYGPEG